MVIEVDVEFVALSTMKKVVMLTVVTCTVAHMSFEILSL